MCLETKNIIESWSVTFIEEKKRISKILDIYSSGSNEWPIDEVDKSLTVPKVNED